MIARMHSITEATVKLHMKAILRKIRVANRTQAAIWAVRKEFNAGDDAQGMRMINGRAS
jgi:two-component system nitrate/nitrite response regulator NarL